MAYLAYYRAFRPTTFDEVVRQEHVVRILKNQIASDKVGHAYLFCGPRGTGKTTLAKIFARAINCQDPKDCSPCGKCPACKALADGAGIDIIEIDAASNNGVDEMRDLREKVQYPPVAGKYKVYIIDEVHMLTASAFNAVLKTLEEPPRHAVFILATTEPQKIPATILSRCMRFDFKLIPQSDLEGLIKSVFEKTGKEYEDAAVSAIVRAGAGSARDCLSIADMCASYSQGKLTYDDVNAVLGGTEFALIAEICGLILSEDASGALAATESALAAGKSVGVLMRDMLSFMNDCTIAKVCRTSRSIINRPDECFNKIYEIASAADGHKILRVTEILSKAETDMKSTASAKITLETAIYKCAMPQSDYDIDALIGKINTLEKRLEEGNFAPAAAVKKVEIKQDLPPVTEEKKPTVIDEPKAEKIVEEKPVYEQKTPQYGKVTPLLEEETQPTLWDDVSVVAAPATPSVGDKSGVFAKFLKSLRTTHKNAVLFTLCMDLECAFESEKMILLSDSETVVRALARAENTKFIADVLQEFGVVDFEVRLKVKGESQADKAVEELKQNFDGFDIDIK